MRGLAGLPAFVLLSMLAGCAGSAPVKVESPPDLRELGRPWPVKVGEFRSPLTVISHDQRGAIFAVGRDARETYRLDYTKRTLTRISARPSAHQAENGGTARIDRRGTKLVLFVAGPDGDQVVISETVLPAEGPGFAQTKDRSAIAFYESAPGGSQLVYYDQITGSRTVWRSLPTPPVRARLGWSTSERYLVEALAGQLIVYDREAGLAIGSVAGTKPLFAPTDLYLLFLRADGRHGLLDLRSGYDWPILPAGGNYRLLPAAFWTPDGSRVLIQAEATAETGPGAPPFQLYLCSVATSLQRRYPLKAPLDLSRYAVLLQAAHPEVERLLAIIPQLRNGPLVPLDGTGYLVGRDRKMEFLGLSARMDPIRAFPDQIRELSLTGAGRRLLVITGGRNKVQVYAWRLPVLSALTQAFPDERDLALGRLRLGMTTAEVLKILGRPLDRERRPDPLARGETLETLRYPEAAATFARGRLIRLIYSASGTATWRGIGIGSTTAAVYEKYGRPGYARADYLSYQGKVNGIEVKVAFQFGADRKVAAILVAKSDRNTARAK